MDKMNKLKKLVKGLLFQENGSVSIYAIIIILPIFILNALLIDTMRILASERQLENAMESALRSTMSKFDSSLSEVGLFAYGGGNAAGDFENYLDQSIYESSDLSGYKNLSTPSVDQVSVTLDQTRNLVDYNVFESQVVESMKYQAPIQIGKDLFELFSKNKVSQEDIDNAEKLVENYEEILKLMKQRNEKIDKAIEFYDDIKKRITDSIPNQIVGKEVTGDTDKIPNSITTLYQLVAYNERYMDLKSRENAEDEEEKLSSDEKKELQTYKNAIGLQASNKILNLFTIATYHDGVNNNLIGNGGSLTSPSSKSAKDYNDQINEILKDGEGLEELESIKLKDEFFQTIIENLDTTEEKLHKTQVSGGIRDTTNLNKYSIEELIVSFYIVIELGETYIAQRTAQAIKEKADSLKKTELKKIDEEIKNYTKIKQELDKLDVEGEEEKADKSFADFWKIFNDMTDTVSMISGDSAIYSELEGYISQYNGAAGNSGTIEETGRLQFIKDAFNRFKEFIEFMQGFPNSVLNELYINEYILANYGTKAPYSLIDSSSYSYDTKKAQYITYGYTDPGMNYMRFILDVTLILYVVNLFNQMVQGGFAGFVGFLKAVGAAFIQTATEIASLTEKGSLNWRPFKSFGSGFQLKMTPVMFLRILMGMKSTGQTYNEEKMRRIQAVVTKETGVNLLDSPSYIEANVTGKVKLWFIPQLAEVLPGNVEGNYYYYDKKKVYSY